MRTTSPVPVYRSTRDTRNSPLWNPSSKELLNVEEDEAGRLAGFRARFGSGFDSVKESKKGHETADSHTASVTPPSEIKMAKEIKFEDEHNDFSEEDFNILDMISSFGQENAQQGQAASSKKGGKK